MALRSYQHYITLTVTQWASLSERTMAGAHTYTFTDSHCLSACIRFIQHKVTELESLLDNQRCILREVSRSNHYISCSVTKDYSHESMVQSSS